MASTWWKFLTYKCFCSFSLVPQNDIYCWRALSVVFCREYGNLDATNKIRTSNVSIKLCIIKITVNNIKFLLHQARDAGLYECQVSTEPKVSARVHLHVVGMNKETLFFLISFISRSLDIFFIQFHHKPSNENIISNEIFMSEKL